MIQGTLPMQGCTTFAPIARALHAAVTVLVIEAPEVLRLLNPRPVEQAIVLTQKRMLCREMLEKVRPDAIVGPLINGSWDIVDLGLVLESLGYTGDLYALTRPLPRAELVVREVGAVCRGLTVHLLETA